MSRCSARLNVKELAPARMANATADAALGGTQRPLQIRPQIPDILDPHRQPAQAVADAQLGPRLSRDAGVGHDGRVLDQARHAAQALGQLEQLGAFEKAAGFVQAALQDHGDHAAELRHLALGQGVLRM